MTSRESILEDRKDRFKEIRDRILKIEDEKERSREIAKWAVDVGLESPLVPPMAPPILVEVRRKKLAQPSYVIDRSFWDEPDVVNFIREKWTINLRNRDAFAWLHWIRDHLEPDDMERGVLVRNKIYEYALFFKEEPRRESPFEVLKGSHYGRKTQC